MSRRPMNPRQRAFEIAMGRFHELPPEDQLRAYTAMRDYLGSEIKHVPLDVSR